MLPHFPAQRMTVTLTLTFIAFIVFLFDLFSQLSAENEVLTSRR